VRGQSWSLHVWSKCFVSILSVCTR
jgi:hypothetical protein